MREPPRRPNLASMLFRIPTHLRHCWLVALAAVAAGALAAEAPPAATAKPALPPDALGRETPFGTVAGFNSAIKPSNGRKTWRIC